MDKSFGSNGLDLDTAELELRNREPRGDMPGPSNRRCVGVTVATGITSALIGGVGVDMDEATTAMDERGGVDGGDETAAVVRDDVSGGGGAGRTAEVAFVLELTSDDAIGIEAGGSAGGVEASKDPESAFRIVRTIHTRDSDGFTQAIVPLMLSSSGSHLFFITCEIVKEEKDEPAVH